MGDSTTSRATLNMRAFILLSACVLLAAATTETSVDEVVPENLVQAFDETVPDESLPQETDTSPCGRDEILGNWCPEHKAWCTKLQGHLAGVVRHHCKKTCCKALASGARPWDQKSKKKTSNRAGLVHVGASRGKTVTGGGMNNRYRAWNKLGMFEDMYPGKTRFTCDTGYGPCKLTCYSISCSKGGKPLTCETRKIQKRNFSGIAKISPRRRKYTMTGGGLINHYRGGWRSRQWKGRKSMFEDSRPSGNGWVGDMGAGRGDFTAFVRGCKGVECKTVQSQKGNLVYATCPKGYQVTGCGIRNEYRKYWSKLSAFEESYPISATKCRCDGGFGNGRVLCFARCC